MTRRRLSQRQQARIGAIQEKRKQHFDLRAQDALASAADDSSREGCVISRHGQHLAIADAEGVVHHCLSRQSIGEPVCGDRVIWQRTTPGQGVVTALRDRISVLTRPTYGGTEKPLAANLDRLVIVLAPEPVPSHYLLDQYLVAAENLGIGAVIALNKSDLVDQSGVAEFTREFGHYEKIGYPLVRVSAKFEHQLEPLIDQLRSHTSILVGQSGVGKSSLVNALLPDMDIQTGRLSHATRMGRHTTSTASLYTLPQGGYLIDSPGVRSFRLNQMNIRQLEKGFREFQPFIGRCRFSNCSHVHEPDCALIAAAEQQLIHPRRLENFRHMAGSL
ncbi:MAG: ribosome small subunit-dependent GTPase A [Gammaproteobacteria bacterium]|nr:ribosome small subunit-dependent GTPase A [Gammaproteobacteria bacterium]